MIVQKKLPPANKTLNLLHRNLRTCSAKSKERAYKALVRRIVEYSATVWDPYEAKNIQQVEMIQRRAACWVLERYDKLDSVPDMLYSLKWRSLELGRSDVRPCMLYKQVNGKNRRAEWTPGSRLSVIDLSSHVLYAIIARPLFYPRTTAKWKNLPPEIKASMFI